MKESMTTFFIGFILMFIVSAFTVKWDQKNPVVIVREIWIHYGLFTTNGIFYGLAAMGGHDLYRYILKPFFKKLIK